MRFRSYAFRLFALVLAVALGLVLFSWGRGYPQDNPWAALSLSDAVGRFTVLKIDQLHGDFARCRALLDTAGQRSVVVPNVQGMHNCGYADGLVLKGGTGARYRPTTPLSCPLAVGLFLWERQVVQPAALRHFGLPVTTIETYGSYACRPVRGGSGDRLSEHAHANGIDIAAFRLADGRHVSVARAWESRDRRGAFLREVRDGGCEAFATVLSPEYNALHKDHLHLDQASRGGWSFCR